MPHVIAAEIKHHAEVAPEHFRLILHCPEIASEAKAGQFCMLEVQEGLYPFLRRPMCFERIYKDSVSILYKVEGEGTRLMSKLAAGRKMSVQGPLGQPWPIDTNFDRHIMIGGGIGVAPFPALGEELVKVCKRAPEIIIAARSERLLLCDQDMNRMGCKVHLATDDGSAGFHGFASQLLLELKPEPNTRVYTCGPMAMMKATHLVCQELGLDCVASLEAEMACGDGVCLGCVVEAKVEIEAERMVRVCYDGPVFSSSLINWDAY
jgi:dihydroorotate dehydrogenase electron transfer subunit